MLPLHSLVLVFSFKQMRFCLLFVFVYLTRNGWLLISRLASFVDNMTWNVKRSYLEECEEILLLHLLVFRLWKKYNQCSENNEVWYMRCLDKVWWNASWIGDLTKKNQKPHQNLKLTVPQFTFLIVLKWTFSNLLMLLKCFFYRGKRVNQKSSPQIKKCIQWNLTLLFEKQKLGRLSFLQ